MLIVQQRLARALHTHTRALGRPAAAILLPHSYIVSNTRIEKFLQVETDKNIGQVIVSISVNNGIANNGGHGEPNFLGEYKIFPVLGAGWLLWTFWLKNLRNL